MGLQLFPYDLMRYFKLMVVLVPWVLPAERQGNVQLVMSCGLIIYINSVLSVWRFSDYWSGLNSL